MEDKKNGRKLEEVERKEGRKGGDRENQGGGKCQSGMDNK